MLALKDLWPGGPLGDDQKVYDYILEGIKTKNYGVEIVTLWKISKSCYT